MEPPKGFTYSARDTQCVIEHTRTGMHEMNWFLLKALLFWGICFSTVIKSCFDWFFNVKQPLVPTWVVLLAVLPQIYFVLLLMYLFYARTKFVLANETLEITTKVFVNVWRVSIPQDNITKIQQIQDGGGAENEDSFPSWGLRIESAALVSGPIRLMLGWSRSEIPRERTILYRLPYDNSEWLAGVLASWCGIEAKYCAKPSLERASSDAERVPVKVS